MAESRIVIVQALKYVDGIMPALEDRVLEGMRPRNLARNLLSNMRTALSVPSMFAAMRVLRRLQSVINVAAESYDGGELVFETPKMKKSSVNYTVMCIYKSFLSRLTKKFGSRLETMQATFNPYRDVSTALDTVIAYVAQKQFGIEINN